MTSLVDNIKGFSNIAFSSKKKTEHSVQSQGCANARQACLMNTEIAKAK